MQVCMPILPMWFLGLHVLIYMFVYTWVMRIWILHVFGYVYTWNNDSHVEYVWMWFSSPWCLVYWFAYLPLCDCYFMSPRVLIDWWLQDAILEFTCLFGSICLLHCLWLQFIWYVVFISFSSGYIYIFLINIFLWIYICSHVIFIDGIVDSSFHNKRLHVCTFFKEREKKVFQKVFQKCF